MSSPTDILTEGQIASLWRAGFTIAKRQSDPFEIDPKLIPRGMAYQWNDTGRENPGWREVPFNRHPGVFGPWDAQGSVEIGNLYLCERPKADVDKAADEAHAKAYQNVTDWISNQGGAGFTGSVVIGGQTRLGVLDSIKELNVGDVEVSKDGDMAQVGATKTIETIVAIPRDMIQYVADIFKERDRLEAEVVRKDRTLVPGPIADKFYATIEVQDGAQWWPTLRAILLPIAIDNVREALKKETTDE